MVVFNDLKIVPVWSKLVLPTGNGTTRVYRSFPIRAVGSDGLGCEAVCSNLLVVPRAWVWSLNCRQPTAHLNVMYSSRLCSFSCQVPDFVMFRLVALTLPLVYKTQMEFVNLLLHACMSRPVANAAKA